MSQRAEKFINIKVKTLNLSTFDIIANPQKSISSLLLQIQQKTRVPIPAQRILYKGLMLAIDKSLHDYKIEQGNILQLIANRIPSEVSQKSSLKRSEVARINKNSQEYLKFKKHRYLQLRLHGFKAKREESLEAMLQNKHTIDQLIVCFNDNYLHDVIPFKIDRRKLAVGEWVDIRDSSDQWAEGQIINEYTNYVLVHFNGYSRQWDEWISVGSDRIMPFRTFTVQSDTSPYLSPFPMQEPLINSQNNTHFKTDTEDFIHDLTTTMESLTKLMKDLQFDKKSDSKQSLKNVSNVASVCAQNGKQEQLDTELYLHGLDLMQGSSRALEERNQRSPQQSKEQFETPSKEILGGDNLSNKCEDDISNKCDNDDISNKSYKSKRSQGLVDTSSMKSLIINESRKRINKVFYDNSEEAQSVRSVKNKGDHHNTNKLDQVYILEEEDSQCNQQEIDDRLTMRKMELKRKMSTSQLAPLLDRLGRLLVDLAPHVAMIGHTQQTINSFNQNLSTFTNQGSLQSKISNLKNRLQQNYQHTSPLAQNSFCQFQIPVMLTPYEILTLNRMLEEERRINQQI